MAIDQKAMLWGLGGAAVIGLLWFASRGGQASVAPSRSGYVLDPGSAGVASTTPQAAPSITYNIPALVLPPSTSQATGAPVIFDYTPPPPLGITFGSILPGTGTVSLSPQGGGLPLGGSGTGSCGCGQAGSSCSNCPNGQQTSFGDVAGIASILQPFVQKLVAAMPSGVVAPALFDPGAHNVFKVEDELLKRDQRALFGAADAVFAGGQA